MPLYMLDMDTCSYIMKRSSEALLHRLQQVAIADVCISVITKSELLYGVELSPRRQKDEAACRSFLRQIDVLDFPENAASHYAKICADLKARGEMIGANDLLIAAHARSLGLVLVTSNTREFGRIADLAIENWNADI